MTTTPSQQEAREALERTDNSDHGTLRHADYIILRDFIRAHPDAPSQSRQSAPARIIELARRLVASGPKAAHVSASECHEISEYIFGLGAFHPVSVTPVEYEDAMTLGPTDGPVSAEAWRQAIAHFMRNIDTAVLDTIEYRAKCIAQVTTETTPVEAAGREEFTAQAPDNRLRIGEFDVWQSDSEQYGAVTVRGQGKRTLIERGDSLYWLFRQMLKDHARPADEAAKPVTLRAYVNTSKECNKPPTYGVWIERSDRTPGSFPILTEGVMTTHAYENREHAEHEAEEWNQLFHGVSVADEAAKGEAVAWLLYGVCDDGTPWVEYCRNEGALFDAVAAAVFFLQEELDDEHKDEVRAITDDLMRSSAWHPEGDASLYAKALTAAEVVPAAAIHTAVQAAYEDAARYRWIKEHGSVELHEKELYGCDDLVRRGWALTLFFLKDDRPEGESLSDAAIDAAIARGGQ